MRTSLPLRDGRATLHSAAPTLVDPDQDDAFRRDGYVVLDALGDAELAAARAAWAEVHPEPGHGFEYDVVRRAPEATARLEAAVGPMWDALLDRTLVDHRRFLLSFLTKWPDPTSAHHLHQDWTYVDERRYRTLSFWVALDDCSPALENGPVAVIPGSHHLVDAYRGPAVVDWYRDLAGELEALLEPVPVRAGQAILIDNALLHGSPPNHSTAPRRGMAAAVAPRAASFRFAAPAPGDEVVLHDLGPTYMPTFDPDDPDSDDRPVLAVVPRIAGVAKARLTETVDRPLPPDLARAPDQGSDVGPGQLAAAAAAGRRELGDARAAGWHAVPAPFLPGWSPAADASDRLLPLVLDGRPTLAGRGPFAQTCGAVRRHDPAATAWIAELRPGRTWTQLTARPTGRLSVVVLDDGEAAGSVTADGVPVMGPRPPATAATLANRGSTSACVLVVDQGPTTRATARAQRNRLVEADEALAAVRPPPGPDEVRS